LVHTEKYKYRHHWY